MLALPPACFDEGEMAPVQARTRCAAVGHEPARPHPAAHGVAGCAETASDLLGRQTFAVEAQGRLAAVASPAAHVRWHCLRQIRGAGGVVHGAVRHLSDLGLVPLDDSAQGLGSVDEQVPAIRDLRRRRCSRARGLGVGSRTVAADDGHARMGGEPVPHRCRRAAGQQIDDAPPLQVTHDGAVGSAAPPRPIVDADHLRRRSRYGPATTDQAQDGFAADRHGQPPRQSCAGLTHPAPCRCRSAPRPTGRCGAPCAHPAPARVWRRSAPGNGRGGSGAPEPATSPTGSARAGRRTSAIICCAPALTHVCRPDSRLGLPWFGR